MKFDEVFTTHAIAIRRTSDPRSASQRALRSVARRRCQQLKCVFLPSSLPLRGVRTRIFELERIVVLTQWQMSNTDVVRKCSSYIDRMKGAVSGVRVGPKNDSLSGALSPLLSLSGKTPSRFLLCAFLLPDPIRFCLRDLFRFFGLFLRFVSAISNSSRDFPLLLPFLRVYILSFEIFPTNFFSDGLRF